MLRLYVFMVNRYKWINIELECCTKNLKSRGPDAFEVLKTDICDYNFLFASSVLWLQGPVIVKQPIETDTAIVTYNGDVFGGTVIPDDVRVVKGDTVLFAEALQKSDNISKTLSNVYGPYAFIYLDKVNANLYFGRDVFGRRSLLIGQKNDIVFVTSVATKNVGDRCIELPAVGTFCFNLKTKNLSVLPWHFQNKNFSKVLMDVGVFLNMQIEVEYKLKLLKGIPFKEPSPCDITMFENISKLGVSDAFVHLLKTESWNQKLHNLKRLLTEAVRKRIATQPQYCQDCLEQQQPCNHALTGVLFSGGIDCAVLALLADQFTEGHRPIDLLNVAFDKTNDYLTPDRITGLQTLEELQCLRPNRKWNFVEINVTQKELDLERSRHIADLIFPLNTILDDSLGCALWFASRGKTCAYKSPCRILLVGMGADELFGGYTRHRAALQKHGWQRLHETLEEDWQNISHRNLARDDRVVADHARQLRTPYLDEEVVEYVRNLNSWEKTYPSNELAQGLGEKILLRSFAYSLGLKVASSFKKRALQFGSRIANKKENAHEVSPRL